MSTRSALITSCRRPVVSRRLVAPGNLPGVRVHHQTTASIGTDPATQGRAGLRPRRGLRSPQHLKTAQARHRHRQSRPGVPAGPCAWGGRRSGSAARAAQAATACPARSGSRCPTPSTAESRAPRLCAPSSGSRRQGGDRQHALLAGSALGGAPAWRGDRPGLAHARRGSAHPLARCGPHFGGLATS